MADHPDESRDDEPGKSRVPALRRHIEDLRSDPDRVRRSVEEVLRLSDESPYDSGGRRWRREDIYEERLRRRG